MALSILDGTQTATTLSTILSSGQHITAHTVVSLGTQAITDMRGAVSGSVVSISNFPASQVISGTVALNGGTIGTVNGLQDGEGATFGLDRNFPVDVMSPLPAGTNRIGVVTIGAGTVTLGASTSQIGSVTASISNSLTISSLPAISGTVTANGGDGTFLVGGLRSGGKTALQLDAGTGYLQTKVESLPSLVAGTAQIGSVTASISNSLTISSLPAISGTVTANGGNFAGERYGNLPTSLVAIAGFDFPNSELQPIPIYAVGDDVNGHAVGIKGNISGTVTLGASTSQIGSVTASISNSVTIASFATSVTARLINPAGTAVTYAEVGTAGNPSIDVLSVQGVTSGTPLTILNHQGTTVTTSNFTSTTASTVLASANTSREVLTIFNEGAGNLHICAGATCTTIAYQVRLSAGDYYEVPLNQTSLTHSAVFATAGTARIVQIS